MACSYRDGEGGTVDLKEATHFFQMAAEGGHIAGATYLGTSYKYMTGSGVPRSFAEAANRLKKSSLQAT